MFERIGLVLITSWSATAVINAAAVSHIVTSHVNHLAFSS